MQSLLVDFQSTPNVFCSSQSTDSQDAGHFPSTSAFSSFKKRRLHEEICMAPPIEQRNYKEMVRHGDMAGHIYKENKLKMSKHGHPNSGYGHSSYLPTTESVSDYDLASYSHQHYVSQPGSSKKRKVEEVDSYNPSAYKTTALVDPCVSSVRQNHQHNMHQQQPTQSHILHHQSTTHHGNPSHSHFNHTTQHSTMTVASGVPATSTSKTTTAVNSSRSSTVEGDYPIVVGENLNSMSEVYEVLSFLGRGTFGQVVKCRCRTSNRMVAIKILKNHPSYLRQGNVEIQILQTLSQEDTEAHNIVRAIECFQHKNHMCLVFELLEQNLYEYLKSNKFRPLALHEIRPIAQQVLTALAALKNLGLIHADLKPENIMLVNPTNGPMRYRVKVIDFGSACQSAKAVQNTYLQSRYYRAPEILLGLPFNEAIDMWSLGCVIAELFLGWPLYPGSSEYDQMRYITETQGVPPRDMLKAAGKGSRFFVREPYTYEWRIKAAEEFTAETGQRSKEARKYVFTSLDQIREVNMQQHQASGEEEVEVEDRRQFAFLLGHMLKMRAEERIVPSTALAHPFITTAHLHNYGYSKKAHDSISLMQVCYENRRTRLLDQPRSFSLYDIAAAAGGNSAAALSLLAAGGPSVAVTTRDLLQQAAVFHHNTAAHLINYQQGPPSSGGTSCGAAPTALYPAEHHHHTGHHHAGGPRVTSSQQPSSTGGGPPDTAGLMALQHMFSPGTPAVAAASLFHSMQAQAKAAAAAAAFRCAAGGNPWPGASQTHPWNQLSHLVPVNNSPRQNIFAPPNHHALLVPSLASLSLPEPGSVPAQSSYSSGRYDPSEPWSSMQLQLAQHPTYSPLVYASNGPPPPPALYPAPGLLDTSTGAHSSGPGSVHSHHHFQYAPSSVAGHNATPVSSVAFSQHHVAMGTSGFPIYVSSSDSDSSPATDPSHSKPVKLSPHHLGNAKIKDKKSVPVGRVQPMLKEDRLLSPQCTPLAAAFGPLSSYHNIVLQLAAANQSRSVSGSGPSTSAQPPPGYRSEESEARSMYHGCYSGL